MKRLLIFALTLAAMPFADAREERHAKREPATDPLLDAKAAYVDKRPENFLVDPQLLLGVGEREERTEFLNYHASDSAIDLFVYLYRADQKPPQEWHDDLWVDKIFGGDRPAVVIFYHVGKPQDSTMRVTRQLAEKIPSPERRRALENAVMAAGKKPDRAGQLDRAGIAGDLQFLAPCHTPQRKWRPSASGRQPHRQRQPWLHRIPGLWRVGPVAGAERFGGQRRQQ